MSWGKSFKNFFIEDNEDSEKVDEKIDKVSSIQSSQPVASQPIVQPTVNYQLQNPVVDSKFRERLEKLLDDNDLEGVDYLEFIRAAKAMSDIPGFTEQMRFTSTFTALKASSKLTKARLLETAQHYIDVLSKEEKSFDIEMTQHMSTKVNSLVDQAKKKEEFINAKREELAKINKEIEEAQGQINQLNIDAQSAQTKINFQAQEFKSSLIGLRNEIEQNKQSINNYILDNNGK